MKCSKFRRLLADSGPAALAGNREAEDHLVDCGDCFAVLEAMTEIDSLLPGLPGYDVADEVVEELLANSELAETPVDGSESPKAHPGRLQGWLNTNIPTFAELGRAKWIGSFFDHARRARMRWGIVAVPAVVFIGIVSVVTMRSPEVAEGPQKIYVVHQTKFRQPPDGSKEEVKRREAAAQDTRVSGSIVGSDAAGAGEGEWARMGGFIEGGDQEIPRPATKVVPIPDPTPDQPVPDDNLVLYALEAPAPPPPSEGKGMVLGYPEAPAAPGRHRVNATETVSDKMIEQAIERSFEGDVTVTGSLIPRADLTALSPVTVVQLPHASRDAGRDLDGLDEEYSDQVIAEIEVEKRHNEQDRYFRSKAQSSNLEHRQSAESFRLKIAALEKQADAFRDLGDLKSAKQMAEQLEVLKNQYEEVSGKDYVGSKTDEAKNANAQLPGDRNHAAESDDAAVSAAGRFLDDRRRVDDLTFREPRGYWANTYVPGDRTLRQLKARLDSAAEKGAAGSLHESAHQISQPFDPPDGAALAVYLHGDRTGVETRERMLVQIGLKGTSRRSGMRPAMTVGLVLDLSGEVTPEAATAMRALLQAFAGATELGDRFSLTVAGRPGGTILPPGDLRYGPLTVAMAELFGDEGSGPVLSLEQAATAALETVRADDDPNAPLGSSAVIVVTSGTLGSGASALSRIAHQSAVDGVPWSAIGIGRGVDLSELDTLVLSSQGNRRLLAAAADAEALVDRELAAVSRVVARAVRLRIRLAPGVQLIDVIGSERLGEDRAQRVRDAEQSIDQRLSRNLGIQTDRGLDEEGIQIVIPSYYADDAHVVLLDVVAPGPGPVADVTVRYKDLVHMKNGVARAHLRLGRTEAAAGPLELNVLANLIATEVASGLDAAADAADRGDVSTARIILVETADLVRGVTVLVDGLGQNADLEADLVMLDGYVHALSELQAGDGTQVRTMADSLRYAGRLKILPPPVGDDQPE
jgi:hypothetical protein